MKFLIKHIPSGDEAEAISLGGALCAARTLVSDNDWEGACIIDMAYEENVVRLGRRETDLLHAIHALGVILAEAQQAEIALAGAEWASALVRMLDEWGVIDKIAVLEAIAAETEDMWRHGGEVII